MKKPSAFFLPVLLSLSVAGYLHGAASAFVDDHGVMRWSDSRQEIALFGVNYTAPFAHAFRAHKAIGVPVEQAIDADVYHLARLGFDAYRIHVWDREISDAEGNVLVNDHVKAFDYLMAKLKARGIKSILTPLQFGDAGYPARGEPLIGFSSKYGKKGSLEDKTSWPLQERYLSQFVSHVNPSTGLAYKDDPDVLAFEICNEPGHHDYALTVDYINRMVKAIRDTGCEKPIFYNMSHGLSVFKAYLDANVQGGTFQWYPANLVAGHEQFGNFLAYVDDYPIPFAADPKFQSKAKMVYEFDTADIGRSYLYPAMARTFRKAGMQFATQFAYDPMYIAPFNTEYRTHYLNLAYAPQKALSMKIAGEAFRRMPLYQDYGPYPGNTTFTGVRLSYERDLAELVTDQKFYYTNPTTTRPPAPQSLEHVAGYGSSPVVTYPGQGAYFIDRLEPGVWRLEVMPDAVWVRDPFERSSLKKSVCRIAWVEWPIRIELPDLGADFSAAGLNDGNQFQGQANAGSLKIRPGTYLLTRKGVTTKWRREDKWENIALKEFVAPVASIDRTYVLHKPLVEVTAGQDLKITATVVSPQPVKKVAVVAYLPRAIAPRRQGERVDVQAQPGRGNLPGQGVVDLGGAQTFEMSGSGLSYTVAIPASEVNPGTLRYHIAVEGPGGTTSYPAEINALPTDWDFYGQGWQARIVTPGSPVLLFDAAADASTLTTEGRDLVYELVPSDRPGTTALQVIADDLEKGEHDHSLRFFFRDKVSGRNGGLGSARKLAIYGRSATDKACPVQLALITADGIAYGATVMVEPKHGVYAVQADALQQVRSPNIPHGYPVFIHFWSPVAARIPLDLNRAESVLVSIGPSMSAEDYPGEHGVEIERIWLE